MIEHPIPPISPEPETPKAPYFTMKEKILYFLTAGFILLFNIGLVIANRSSIHLGPDCLYGIFGLVMCAAGEVALFLLKGRDSIRLPRSLRDALEGAEFAGDILSLGKRLRGEISPLSGVVAPDESFDDTDRSCFAREPDFPRELRKEVALCALLLPFFLPVIFLVRGFGAGTLTVLIMVMWTIFQAALRSVYGRKKYKKRRAELEEELRRQKQNEELGRFR